MPASARKVAPMIARPPAGSPQRREHIRTPKPSPASMVSHIPVPTWRSRIAGHASRNRCGSARSGRGTMNATATSPAPSTAAPLKAGPVPARAAMVPTTGPNSAPTTAAPNATPRSSPRRSAGAARASQARAAAQVHAPAIPCTKRAVSSTTGADDQPKTSVAALISTNPSRTTGRSPSRAVEHPARQGADQGAEGVGGDQQPGARLRQPVRAGVVRQQRCQGREETVSTRTRAHTNASRTRSRGVSRT